MWTHLGRILNGGPARIRRAARRFVPRLQPLDDRVVPAVFTVTQPRIRNCPANAERWWRQGSIPPCVSMMAVLVWESGLR